MEELATMRAMRRHRFHAAALATLALTAAALLRSAGAPAEPTKSQEFFTKTLLADAKTTAAVKALLSQRGGFVAPEVVFSDLTGDGRSDAVVLVETGGAGGAVALYVFSTDGQPAASDLRAVYRSQRLYRASVQASGDTLTVRTPRYLAGDDICCPARIVERVYTWSATAQTMRQRSSRELPGPAG
jgi:hypothetical protein